MRTEKNFDCVEMKNAIQQKLLREYEGRRSEFRTYAAFVAATADESQRIAAFRKKMAVGTVPA